MKDKPNRLIHEKSPYLLQHAHNPVDWYAWGDEAFETALREDKPVFLSIGYSTCHWCHVMEHESFEDKEVAHLMNEAFVNIKVDREERPDIDGIYMTVCQMINQHGGWPLTILMTPDKKPFFAGTYIPRTSRHGRLGMLDFIPRIQAIWQQERERVAESAEQITDTLRQNTQLNLSGDAPGRDVLEEAYQQLAGRFDRTAGGFSSAPKFPTPHNLMFLLRYWKRTGEAQALHMVEQTLEAMRLGGLYDHVGFGFHRYATDRLWRVPHFEKMLYDQALLVMAYTEAYQATGQTLYAETVREVLTYIRRDMQAPEGGFYSAEDADSEGEEGKFYVWTTDELEQLLGEQDAQLITTLYNTRPEGNFAEEATGQRTGANHFFMKQSLTALAGERRLRAEAVKTHQERVRTLLFAHRETRIHPHKDDKILADWNGLMIAAFAQAGRVFAEPEYVDVAEQATTFVLSAMSTPEGHLLHRYREGEAGLMANLDDYAFMVHGLIELYQVTFKATYLKSALELTRTMIDLFWDKVDGGFFFTPNDGEPLLIRQKESYDGAVPSGNSVALMDLVRLGRITGDVALEERAGVLGTSLARAVKQIPSGHCWMMTALEFVLGIAYEVVVVGDPDDADTMALLNALNTVFLPNKVVVLKPVDSDEAREVVSLIPYLAHHKAVNAEPTAYVCRNYACDRPTNDMETMLAQLGAL